MLLPEGDHQTQKSVIFIPDVELNREVHHAYLLKSGVSSRTMQHRKQDKGKKYT